MSKIITPEIGEAIRTMTPAQYRAAKSRVNAEQCRRHMARYMRDVVWPTVEPGTPYVHNWHIDAICEHLEAVLKGEIANLLVNMPPRFAKSLLISVTMPTWAWIDRPEMRSIFASYSGALSIRDALKSRRVINSPLYQEYYGDRFKLSEDQDVKARYENDKTGFRMSTSVGGMGTGEGGDILVVDDPHNVLAAESDTVREEAWLWWTETMSSRLNNPNRGGKIVVMQRVHESDVSGHILAEQASEYTHLKIPMRYEKPRVQVQVPGSFEATWQDTEKTVTPIGFSDPREEEGALAWAERFNESAVVKLENAMGAYAVAGQFQQRPAPRGGSLIMVDRINIIDVLPANIVWVRCWDLAATEKQTSNDPAWTAGVLIGKDYENRFYIGDVIRERLKPNEIRDLVKRTAEHDGKAVKIRIPQDPGQAGKSQAGDFIGRLAGWTVTAVPETGSKEQRAEPFASQVEGNNVYMLRAKWNAAYKAELGMFPAGKFKDQTDATSNGFNELIPLPNNIGNMMEYMRRKVEAMNQENAKPAATANVYRDRTDGAKNVTDLGYLLAGHNTR